jgi:hypothetical protein
VVTVTAVPTVLGGGEHDDEKQWWMMSSGAWSTTTASSWGGGKSQMEKLRRRQTPAASVGFPRRSAVRLLGQKGAAEGGEYKGRKNKGTGGRNRGDGARTGASVAAAAVRSETSARVHE